MLLSNNGTFESLDTLLVAFLDADGDANGVADFELGLVLFDHTLGKMLDCVHVMNSSMFLRRSYTNVSSEDRLYNDLSLSRRWLGGTNALVL